MRCRLLDGDIDVHRVVLGWHRKQVLCHLVLTRRCRLLDRYIEIGLVGLRSRVSSGSEVADSVAPARAKGERNVEGVMSWERSEVYGRRERLKARRALSDCEEVIHAARDIAFAFATGGGGVRRCT